MCIYFTVLLTVYKCHCVNMLCSPLAEENKVSIYLVNISCSYKASNKFVYQATHRRVFDCANRS